MGRVVPYTTVVVRLQTPSSRIPNQVAWYVTALQTTSLSGCVVLSWNILFRAVTPERTHSSTKSGGWLRRDRDIVAKGLEDVEVGVERRHDLARVRAESEARQERDGARHLGLGQEAHEANHREAAVVDLGDQALGLLLGRRVLGELERVKQVERHRVRERVERREISGLAAAHVVRLAVRREHVRVLAPELEEANGQNHLPLGHLRGQIPRLLRRDAERHRGPRASPRPAEVVGVNDVADEAEHGDAAMLDLSLVQEADRVHVRLAPEFSRG